MNTLKHTKGLNNMTIEQYCDNVDNNSNYIFECSDREWIY